MNRQSAAAARISVLSLLASAALVGALAGPATAATFTVTTTADSGAGSLRAAIDAANSASGADIITFSVTTPATITLASALPTVTEALTINGIAGAGNITIDAGGNSWRIISNTAALTIRDVTLTGGNVTGDGGAISVGGALTLEDVIVANNAASNFGGAIGTTAATSITVRRTVFQGNSAGGGGGAIDVDNAGATLTIEDSTFTDNSTAGVGGAVSVTGASTIARSTFTGNDAVGGAGAILAAPQTADVDIYDSTFSGNTTTDPDTHGGAIVGAAFSGRTVFVSNSTLTANTATGDGGAVYSDGAGNLILTHVTASANAAGWTSGAVARNVGSLAVRNSILANSAADLDCAGINGQNTHNLIESGCASGATALVTSDPGLGALGNNGGPTQTMAITSSSPAYDAASSLICSVEDQRGEPRNIEDCDIGAYEAADVTGPSVVSVAAPANGTYRAGQNLDFTVTWSEIIQTTGTPRIPLTVGTSSVFATQVSAPTATTRVFRYTVQAGDAAGTGVELGASIQLNGGTITDQATPANNATLTLNNVGSTTGVLVDAVAPFISTVTGPGDGISGLGASVDFTVSWSEEVAVTGSPRIVLDVGGSTRHATYLSGSGSTQTTFRYVPQAGDTDTDGLAISGSAIDLNGGTVKDLGGTNATLTINGVDTFTHAIDTTAPSITAVVVPADGTYGTTEPLEFVVTWDEDILVSNPPRIQLTVGSTTRYATRDFVFGPDFTFRYTPQAGDTDTDGIAYVDTIDLNGGTITDDAGNAAALDISAGAATTGVDVDTTVPDASGASVADGLAADIDAQTNIAQMSANWSGFTDADSGIKYYDYAIDDEATCSAPFVVNATDIGLVTEHTATGLTLTPTSTYYWCARAVDDAGNASAWAASDGVLIEEDPGNTAPVCPNAAASVIMNVAKAGDAGCSDVDVADTLTYRIDTQPLTGSASINSAGTWTYTPALNTTGVEQFTIVANDGTVDSAPGTITVTTTNQPINAKNDVLSIPPLSASTLNVLANDSPGTGEAGQPLTIVSVTQGSKGKVTNKGTSVSYDPTSCNVGNDSFTYSVTDGGGAPQTKTVAVTILRPGQGGLSTTPRTDTPGVSFVTGSTMGTTVPMKLSWCGVTTSTTSVRGYRVGQSTNGTAATPTYGTTLFSSTTARSSTRNLSVNQDYRWRVRTTDTAGRTSTYRSSLTSIVRRYQDTSSRITYTGTWGTSTAGSPSGGSQRFTSTAGRSAQITVTNVRAFAIVGPRSSTRGSYRVYVDDVLVKTVSQKASSTSYRRLQYWRSLTSGTGVSHTIRIEAVGNGRVDLDAILTLASQ